MTIAEHLSAGGWTEGEAVALLAAATWLLVLGGYAVLRWRRRRQPGAPEDELLEDTRPLEHEALTLTRCPHDVPLSRECERCKDVLRGKHIDLDDTLPPGAA